MTTSPVGTHALDHGHRRLGELEGLGIEGGCHQAAIRGPVQQVTAGHVLGIVPLHDRVPFARLEVERPDLRFTAVQRAVDLEE